MTGGADDHADHPANVAAEIDYHSCFVAVFVDGFVESDCGRKHPEVEANHADGFSARRLCRRIIQMGIKNWQGAELDGFALSDCAGEGELRGAVARIKEVERDL